MDVPGLEQGSTPAPDIFTDAFREGLKSAGYLELFEVSRKKIKSRFAHGLAKEKVRVGSLSLTASLSNIALQFNVHLEAFLEQKQVKKRGEFMIRFVGEQGKTFSRHSARANVS